MPMCYSLDTNSTGLNDNCKRAKKPLKSMVTTLSFIKGIRPIYNGPSQTHASKGPDVRWHTVDNLFGERLDPGEDNLLLIRR